MRRLYGGASRLYWAWSNKYRVLDEEKFLNIIRNVCDYIDVSYAFGTMISSKDNPMILSSLSAFDNQ